MILWNPRRKHCERQANGGESVKNANRKIVARCEHVRRLEWEILFLKFIVMALNVSIIGLLIWKRDVNSVLLLMDERLSLITENITLFGEAVCKLVENDVATLDVIKKILELIGILL